jgi:hypothetical protein
MRSWILPLLTACREPEADDPVQDADADADTDTDTDSDTDTDADTDTEPTPCTIYPSNNEWNKQVVEYLPHELGEGYLDGMGRERRLRVVAGTGDDGAPIGIPYVEVAGEQPLVPVTFLLSEESEPGTYAIPPEAPVEGGASSFGDRHVVVLDRDNCRLYELFEAWPVDFGASWRATAGAIFDLTTNELRPDGWRSADPSGLPILPGLLRYEEVDQGLIPHALRMTVGESQMAYIPPATDYASTYLDPALPPMGLRLKLRPDYDCSPLSAHPRAICEALQAYGVLISAEGEPMALTTVPDSRWDTAALEELGAIRVADLQVVYSGETVIPE